MSGWFKDRRMEFIAANLKQLGQVRRTTLVKEFGISTVQASADIQKFLETDSRIRYDLSAKCYVLEDTDDQK